MAQPKEMPSDANVVANGAPGKDPFFVGFGLSGGPIPERVAACAPHTHLC
jgi:hypothetical protein